MNDAGPIRPTKVCRANLPWFDRAVVREASIQFAAENCYDHFNHAPAA